MTTMALVPRVVDAISPIPVVAQVALPMHEELLWL